jgi:hypothetical protein
LLPPSHRRSHVVSPLSPKPRARGILARVYLRLLNVDPVFDSRNTKVGQFGWGWEMKLKLSYPRRRFNQNPAGIGACRFPLRVQAACKFLVNCAAAVRLMNWLNSGIWVGRKGQHFRLRVSTSYTSTVTLPRTAPDAESRPCGVSAGALAKVSLVAEKFVSCLC